MTTTPSTATSTASPIDRTPPQSRIIFGDKVYTSGSGGIFQHIQPATGLHQADIPLAGKREIDQAVACAKDAFEVWRRMPATQRRALLSRLAELIEANATEFTRLAAIDGGVPLMVGAGGPRMAAEWTNYYAGWADKVDGQVLSTFPSDEFIYTLPEPYGVIGVIITWNGPLISLGMKVGPALAAGNTVVIKPAEQTPFAACLFAELALQAGIPPGVVNVLPGGAEAAEALIGHPDVENITFTGGPIINEAGCDRIMGMIERAKASGAGRITTGGERVGGELAKGYYIRPTVFADVDPASEIGKQEVFGPVLVMHRFKTEEEAIQIANSTMYGLGGYIQTNDLNRAHRVAGAMKTGNVHINGGRNIPAWAPFGGLGISGYGKEGGRQGLDEFVRGKTIIMTGGGMSADPRAAKAAAAT
jgi:acyl-CoA reductase-like NAD-dependent aldehyde dehydrogenase